MKQICAWCGTQLSQCSSPEEDRISYGICLLCANAVIIDMPNNLHDFLDQIPVPIVLLDCVGTVQTANNMACAMLNKALPHIEGKFGGDVFECAYALLPGGCGHTYHCSGCVIRKSVMDTHATGKGVNRVPASLKQYTPEAPQEIKFLISTEKFEDYVMLKIYAEDSGK